MKGLQHNAQMWWGPAFGETGPPAKGMLSNGKLENGKWETDGRGMGLITLYMQSKCGSTVFAEAEKLRWWGLQTREMENGNAMEMESGKADMTNERWGWGKGIG